MATSGLSASQPEPMPRGTSRKRGRIWRYVLIGCLFLILIASADQIRGISRRQEISQFVKVFEARGGSATEMDAVLFSVNVPAPFNRVLSSQLSVPDWSGKYLLGLMSGR